MTFTPSDNDELKLEIAAARISETLRLNDRYALEVVEAFSFCPYARPARVAQKAARKVLLQSTLDIAPVVAMIEAVERASCDCEVVQLIFPRLRTTAREFDDFTAQVRVARETRSPRPSFAQASFHPGFTYDATTPEAMVPFVRRSPDATIQMLRVTTLDALAREDGPRGATAEQIQRFLRGEGPPPASLSSWISGENHARVQRVGRAVVDAVYDSIMADRERSHARLRALGRV